MIIWQTDNQLNRVLGGRKVELACSGCLKQSTFYESEVEEKFKIYFVVELWKKTKRILQCGACLGICDYYEIFPEEKNAEEAAEAARKQKAADEEADRARRVAEADLKRKIAEEQEQKRRDLAERIRREEEKQRKESAVDDELTKLKKRMGK